MGKDTVIATNGIRNVYIITDAPDFQMEILEKWQSGEGLTSCSINYDPSRLECQELA